ncbi:hypothetical protein HPB50_020632 [Hyalomma asiaticum]|uniref:Uncharacterized protein n=2 Tax=Hyalomma asiaticum TaxID=266040 RepID=A0ACB7S9Y1_HYAAI|nr:hypothetical protein HPB50_020632 [Hyalomma asiaticum]
MSKAADGTTEAPSDLPDDTNAMHTDRTEVQNAAATWRYDASSGRTIERESVWITRGRKGKRDAGGKTTQEATPTKEETSTQQSQPQRRKPTMPPLPFDDYKVVYRPQAGLELAKWNNIAIVHAIGKASGFAQQDFSEKVCVQAQRLENLIIASTAEWEDAKKLESITSIQLGGTLFTIKSNTRTPDDVSRGVISGLLPGTSEEELKAGLRAPARYTAVLHERMLGQSSTAVIFFQGPHVPYYVRFHSLDFRCRPYRKSVQYCKTCGNTGHRQDVCPRPLPGFCSKCGKTNQPPDHMCKPACKLRGEEHETASKDCKKRLKPNPPPFHIRQQRMDRNHRIKARDCRWSLADEEFPELTSQTTNLHSSADGAPTRGRSRSALRPRSRSRSRSRSCSPKRVSYANVASGSSGSETTSRSTFLSPENEALRVLQDKVHVQQSALQHQASQLQSQQALIDKLIQSHQKQQDNTNRLLKKCEEQRDLIDKLYQKSTISQNNERPTADVESIVNTRFQLLQEALMKSIHTTVENIVQAAIQNFAASMATKVTTLDAKVDGLAAQLNNFIAHVKNTYVTKQHLNTSLSDLHPDRKRARANGRNTSRSISPTRDSRQRPESTEHGGP